MWVRARNNLVGGRERNYCAVSRDAFMNYEAPARHVVNYSVGELGRFNPRVLYVRGARVGRRMDDDSANPRSILFVEAIDVLRARCDVPRVQRCAGASRKRRMRRSSFLVNA